MSNEPVAVEVEELVFTREALEELSRRNNEPEWLLNKRLRSWFIYQDMPWVNKSAMPHISSRFEKKDLQLGLLDLSRQSEAGEGTAQDLIRTAQSVSSTIGERSGQLVQNNCVTLKYELSEAARAQGVIFTDMQTAVHEHGDLLEQHLMTKAVHLNDNKLVALHGAFWQGGSFLYIPKNVEVEFPLQSFFLVNEQHTAYFPHTVIIAEQGSKATFIETHASPDLQDRSFVNAVVEIFTGENADLRFISLQEYGRNIHHYGMKRAVSLKDSTLTWCEVALGSDVTRSNIESIMDQSGCTVNLLGLYFPTGDQHMEFNTMQIHAAPHSLSDLLYKGALRDKARSVFEGLIRVNPGAQKTNAYQANRNMLLGSGARADSIPQLEIEANDVRCTHGATVGPINEDQLFYLMSRGLPKEEATRLLVLGFFSQVIDRIPVQDVREGLYHHIENQIA